MSPTAPPTNTDELLGRARRLAGERLGDIARHYRIAAPADPKRDKGWFGQLMEHCLGATAASLAEPDFQALGIELKTVPVDRRGLPRESTYVCAVPLGHDAQLDWEQSWVRRKLQRVLWMPVEADPTIGFLDRRVGMPLLWSPEPHQANALKRDWLELMELVCSGRLDEISARQGTYLQIRPKAANHRAQRTAIGADGDLITTLPRGFYLRSTFTARILQQHYVHVG